MKKYSAINIGPIIDTFSFARKPRELWAASYMFSKLMENIISALVEKKYTIISPCAENPKENKNTGIGVFPDRVFFEGRLEDNTLLKDVLKNYSDILGINNLERFFNVMYASIESESGEGVIASLNDALNKLELFNPPQDQTVKNKVLNIIKMRKISPIARIAFDQKNKEIKSLPEIATHELEMYNYLLWNQAVTKMKEKDEDEEDSFYTDIKITFEKQFRSYHKYVCIVQADGDNMGKIVSKISTDKVKELSEVLMDFSVKACKLIKRYGGMPIYAGGDDLLFFAPVVSVVEGRKTDIFELIDKIDIEYNKVAEKANELKNKNETDVTSMSYGLSITYYKYPLYEALEKARNLLFDKAKNTIGKQAIAWDIQKHSGSTFSGIFSKKYTELKEAFHILMHSDCDSETVSSLAHKLREKESIINLLWDVAENERETRIASFLKKAMDLDDKDDIKKQYIGNAQNMILALYKAILEMEETSKNEDNKKDFHKEDVMQDNLYDMLRTAKFINGEEDDHE